MATYNFPVWGTQGGGLVKESSPGTFVFVEKPKVSGLSVGDEMPPEWGIAPANKEALDLESVGSFHEE